MRLGEYRPSMTPPGYSPSRTFRVSKGAYRDGAEPRPKMGVQNRCTNCDAVHRPGEKCRTEGNRFWQCNKLGHYERCCPEKMTMLRSEDSDRIRTEKTMRSHRFGMINGKKVRFLADTGADTSTMQLRTIEALGLRETMMKS